MSFIKPLIFNPHEREHNPQCPTFDTRRIAMYTPEQLQKFSHKTIHASASHIVIKKLTQTILTQGNTVRHSGPGNLEQFFSLND